MQIIFIVNNHVDVPDSHPYLSVVMMTGSTKQYPFTIASSTGSDSPSLLAAILAIGRLDEISSAENFGSLKRYIHNQGHVDSTTGKTTTGLVFWLYPTGLFGPFHESFEGEHIELHGLMITMESGVELGDAVAQARAGLGTLGSKIAHLHISAPSAIP